MPPKKQNKQQSKKQQPKAAAPNIAAIVKSAVEKAMKVPNAPGNSMLGNFGQFAGNSVSKIFGMGAYRMNSNSLFQNSTGSQVPVMHSSNESVTFRHREFIGDISSSTNFVLTPYSINPGLPSSFPYLSTIASCFQEYRFKGLIYEFKSTGATALVSGTNTAMGTVSMIAQYRADAPVPTNKLEVLNEMWAADAKTSDSFILPVECSPKENPMRIQYVRTGNGYAGDIKLYDLAKLSVATVGSQGSNVVGELWASYEIELFKPLLSPTGGVLASDRTQRSNPAAGSSLFGSTVVATFSSSLGASATNNVLTFPLGTVGTFLVTVAHAGGVAVSITTAAITPSNCSLQNSYSNNTQSSFSAPQNAVSSTTYLTNIVVLIIPTTGLPTLTFSGGVYPNNAVIDIFVTELPDNF